MNETKRTLKEKKFIEAYIKHQGNLTQAYLEISPGCKISSARVLGYRWLQKVNIPAQELLDRLNLNDAILGQKLKEGLEAVKVISGDDKKKDTIPDHNVRVRYLDMAFKLKNVYPGEKGKSDEPEDINIKVELTEEKGDSKERLFIEINRLVERRMKGKREELTNEDGRDNRSEAQKLADRLIACRGGNQNYG